MPTFLQRLLDHHLVDTKAFAEEVSGIEDGRMRTKNWPGSKQRERHVLETLPRSFPRFKGSVINDELLVEIMAIGPARITTRHTMARVRLPAEGLPETLIVSLPRRPLEQLLGHEAIGDDIVIEEVRRMEVDGEPWLDVIINAPRLRLIETQREPTRTIATPVDIEALIARTHALVEPGWTLGHENAANPKAWDAALGGIGPAMGIRRARERPQEGAAIDLLFPYDKQLVGLVGKGGFGAWFDRTANAWNVADEDDALDTLSDLLDKVALLLIDEQGRVHVNRRADTVAVADGGTTAGADVSGADTKVIGT